MEPTNQNQDQVDQALQNMVNKPPVDPTGFDDGTKNFIEGVMKLVFDGTIVLHQPSSLINESVYEQADFAVKGKADIMAVNLCAKLRELKTLTDISGGEQLYIEPTYQAKLLVEDIKYRKEEFEKQYGDLMII